MTVPTFNSYDKGEPVRCSITFRNSAGVVADPTAVSFYFRTPAGVETVYVYPTDAQIVKDSVGNYHVDLIANEPYWWHYKWRGTGVVALVEPGLFSVKPDAFT